MQIGVGFGFAALDPMVIALLLHWLAGKDPAVISGGGGLDMRAKELMCWLSGKFPSVMGAPVHMEKR